MTWVLAKTLEEETQTNKREVPGTAGHFGSTTHNNEYFSICYNVGLRCVSTWGRHKVDHLLMAAIESPT